MAGMPDYAAPGVLVDESRGGRRAIEGVDTDLAGFVGVTERGPTAPTLIRSWTEFEKTFGGFVDRPPFVTPYWRLPYAVHGFFANGGRRCVVGRVLDAMADATPGDLAAFVGDEADPDARTGIAALMALPDVSLVAAPDDVVAPEVATALLDRCDTARDRMAIVNTALNAADLATIARHRGTAFGALYYPRLHVPAPHLKCGYAVVPPSGHVAGVLAKAAFASGPHLPPKLAGHIADNHPCRVGPLDRPVTAADAEWLAPRGVNVLRDFRNCGKGVLVWGGRTMSSDPEWKYVNVRRFFIFLEQSIDRGLQWVVFEPNHEATWMAVRTEVTNFLLAQWRNGAMVGNTPEDAFFVKCDRTTMTQDDIDNGRLVCLVGIAPVRPAEFVIFRIGQWTADRPDDH